MACLGCVFNPVFFFFLFLPWFKANRLTFYYLSVVYGYPETQHKKKQRAEKNVEITFITKILCDVFLRCDAFSSNLHHPPPPPHVSRSFVVDLLYLLMRLPQLPRTNDTNVGVFYIYFGTLHPIFLFQYRNNLRLG